MNRPAINVIRDILIEEMALNPDRIWIYNNNAIIPKDEDLYVILTVSQRPPFSNNVFYEDTGAGLEEVQSMNVQEVITISICSKNAESRNRSHEVQMAMGSTFSQKKQEELQFHISRISPSRDLSFLEQTSMINRFDCEVRVLTVFEKRKSVDYYDKLNTVETIFNE